MILRLTRTFPRNKFNGVGLSAYYLQKFSNKRNIIFTKKINSKILKLKKKNVLIEIDYKDLKFNQKNVINFIPILITKIYGEIIFFTKIYKYLKQKNLNPSIIHVHSINYIFSGILLKSLYNIPLFLNFTGSDFYRLKKLKILNLIISKVDKVFNVSKKINNELIKLFKNNKKFIHTSNGFDNKIFKNKNLKRKNQFVAVGNLRWQKNYEKMIYAFKLFTKKNNKYKLLIIGNGDKYEKQNLTELIKKNNLEKFVYLKGNLNHKEIAKILNESYLFLMSSKSEGLPKSLIEAIACGTPIITTNAGDCSYVAKNCGIIMDYKCSDIQYSRAIIKLISNKQKWKKFRLNCLKKKYEFSWKKYVSKINKYY